MEVISREIKTSPTGYVYPLSKPSYSILNHLAKPGILTVDDINDEELLLNDVWCSSEIVSKLMRTKDKIDTYYSVYTKYRDRIIPKSHIYERKMNEMNEIKEIKMNDEKSKASKASDLSDSDKEESIKSETSAQTEVSSSCEIKNDEVSNSSIDLTKPCPVKSSSSSSSSSSSPNMFHSKYHTFIKLMQALDLADVKTNFSSFYDVCFAPGAFSEGLLRCYDIKYCYGITLISKDTHSLKIDRSIINNPVFKQISPDDGNIYYFRNLEESMKLPKVDIVCADGGMDIRGMKINENLQSLISFHLIFCEFMYAISCLNNGGVFVCKLFDTFDDLTAQALMAISLYFDEILITKPRESREVNSERYLVCKGFMNFRFIESSNDDSNDDSNDEDKKKDKKKDEDKKQWKRERIEKSLRYLTHHLHEIMKKSEDYIPAPIFELSSDDTLYRGFLHSLKIANERIAIRQINSIDKTIRKCLELAKEEFEVEGKGRNNGSNNDKKNNRNRNNGNNSNNQNSNTKNTRNARRNNYRKNFHRKALPDKNNKINKEDEN